MRQIFCYTRGQGTCTTGRSSGLGPFLLRREPVAPCLVARRWLCLVLEQLQQPLSAPPREFPCGQPPSWDRGGCVRVLGERLGGRTHLYSDVVGLFLALHGLSLQQILDLEQVMVYRVESKPL